MAEEDILIRIRAIDEATQTIRNVSKSLGQISASTQNLTTGFGKVQRTIVQTYKPAIAGFNSMGEATNAAGISMNKFNNFARMNFLEVQKGGIVMDKLTGQTMSYGQAAKDAAIKSRRFKFEWLSIMFAGMALDRAFGGLVRSQLELFGVTDLMSTAWTVVLLPIMEKITPFLYDLIDAFMNLPEPIKEAIGGFVLFGAGLGTILTVVGQLALALMGFKLLAFSSGLTGVGSAAAGATGKIGGLAGALKGLAGIVAIGISLSLVFSAMGEEDVITALAKIFGGGLAAGIAALLLGVGVPAAIAIGALVALVALTIKFNFDDKWRDAVDDFFQGIVDKINKWIDLIKGYGFIKGIKLAKQKEPDVIYDIETGVAGTPEEIRRLGSEEWRRQTAAKFGGAPTQNITVSPNYNITVSDKSEMEKSMKENNLTLVEEIKRQVNV